MSAYVVDLNHIAYLVQAAGLPSIEAEQQAGQMLWDENVKSVRYRYPKHTVDREVYPVDTPRFPGFDPVQVIKACECYAYQSCEPPEWEESDAYAFVEGLKRDVCDRLPGYDKAAWGAPKREATVSR